AKVDGYDHFDAQVLVKFLRRDGDRVRLVAAPGSNLGKIFARRIRNDSTGSGITLKAKWEGLEEAIQSAQHLEDALKTFDPLTSDEPVTSETALARADEFLRYH